MNHLCKYIEKKDMPYIIAVAVLGTLNHFLYELSGGAAIFALFCPVNESTWEHLKLLFFPFLFASIWQYINSSPRSGIINFFYHRLLAVLCGMASIITLFYTYTGVVGRHFLIMDILIFLFGILFSFYVASACSKKRLRRPSQTIVFSSWVILCLCFFAFTCFPPNIPLFFPRQ